MNHLSPLPIRLLVYAALIVIALLAIRVIDRHVMARQQPTTTATPPTMPAPTITPTN